MRDECAREWAVGIHRAGSAFADLHDRVVECAQDFGFTGVVQRDGLAVYSVEQWAHRGGVPCVGVVYERKAKVSAVGDERVRNITGGKNLHRVVAQKFQPYLVGVVQAVHDERYGGCGENEKLEYHELIITTKGVYYRMENRVLGRRTGFGLVGSAILTGILLVVLVIGIMLLWNNMVLRFALMGGAVVAVVFFTYGVVNIIIAPPKNSIELIDGKLHVRPSRGVEHVIGLGEITRVDHKVHVMGFADSFYYGKVVIETRNRNYTVPFVAQHRRVAEEIRSLLP